MKRAAARAVDRVLQESGPAGRIGKPGSAAPLGIGLERLVAAPSEGAGDHAVVVAGPDQGILQALALGFRQGLERDPRRLEARIGRGRLRPRGRRVGGRACGVWWRLAPGLGAGHHPQQHSGYAPDGSIPSRHGRVRLPRENRSGVAEPATEFQAVAADARSATVPPAPRIGARTTGLKHVGNNRTRAFAPIAVGVRASCRPWRSPAYWRSPSRPRRRLPPARAAASPASGSLKAAPKAPQELRARGSRQRRRAPGIRAQGRGGRGQAGRKAAAKARAEGEALVEAEKPADALKPLGLAVAASPASRPTGSPMRARRARSATTDRQATMPTACACAATPGPPPTRAICGRALRRPRPRPSPSSARSTRTRRSGARRWKPTAPASRWPTTRRCARPTNPCGPSTASASSTTPSIRMPRPRASASSSPKASRPGPISRPTSRSRAPPTPPSPAPASRSASTASSTASATPSWCARACPRRRARAC